jgi:hypothetical protein
LDEKLGLRPGEISAELESLLGMVGASMTFGKGADLFERLTLLHVSPQTMDKATQRMGAEMMRLEEEWVEDSEDEMAVHRQIRARRDGRRLYGSLDATKVHTYERRDEEDEGWRDLKVVAWFETDKPPPDTPNGDWEIKAKEMTYHCNFIEAKAFGKLLWATGFRRKALQASELVFLGDGAEWIWNLVQNHYPQAVQIVDWFHAAERLGDVAKAAYKSPDERERWRQRMRQFLWDGQVERVVHACASLADAHVEEAARAANYFDNNKMRMRYDRFRNNGYQIGSGSVESACKQLGILRMKVPGATWNLSGARFTAKARAAFLSDQWNLIEQRRVHLPRAA